VSAISGPLPLPQASRLKYLAETFSIPVLVTNQVTTRIGGGGGGGGHLTAALGTLWAHAVNTRLVLELAQGGGPGGAAARAGWGGGCSASTASLPTSWQRPWNRAQPANLRLTCAAAPKGCGLPPSPSTCACQDAAAPARCPAPAPARCPGRQPSVAQQQNTLCALPHSPPLINRCEINSKLLSAPAGTRFLRIAKSPAAAASGFAYHVTAAGLEVLPGVEVPPELLQAGSVAHEAIANEQAYEQQAPGFLL
jgi:hypothetical protein